MSLTPRDTFVRYIDPMETIWEDAEGNHHLSIANTLKAFELEDTPENREVIKKSFREVILTNRPTAVIEERAAPDSDDYWKTISPETRAQCDHKFVGGSRCAKCGWDPGFQGGPMGGA